MNNKPVALTQADILGILQDAYSVPLGQPIFNSSEEYNKLKAIIESAIRYTHPVNPKYDPETGEPLIDGYPLFSGLPHPVKEQDESFDRTASHMAGEYVSWTSCVACGQRVTGDSIHTCSPQLKELTDEEIAYLIANKVTDSEMIKQALRKAQE
jgi:hypothetical protein